ncbi:BrnA antitoxin family protein [Pseudomonas lopnurensis]|uniref:BrnA antitoxin family protein n=1 Tax=Pseudomonas lopnurensis TaxID=1477517 RepID=UPI0028AF7784|nr:BrnA antitoxin family protein [Pseudomonas lopnurensis]
MKKSNVPSATPWSDPDDAPEITDVWVAEADLYDGEKRLRRGRPPKVQPKEQVTLRLDADVLAAFKKDGEGWQTRINAALRGYVQEHRS